MEWSGGWEAHSVDRRVGGSCDNRFRLKMQQFDVPNLGTGAPARWRAPHACKSSNCCSSVTQSRPALCDSMDCSMPGLPVPHHFCTFSQVHVYSIGDAIQPSHPLMPSSPLALNLSQHHWKSPVSWLFTSSGQSIGTSALASVLPMSIQG